MGQLIFSGISLEEDFGIVVDSAESWPKPQRDRTVVHVPGRNGDLIIDNGGYLNVELVYHCLIKDGFRDRFSEFCDLLYANSSGYQDLYDSEHPDVSRKAEFAGPIEPELWFTTETGIFDLVFNAKPLQYVRLNVNTDLDFREADASVTYDNPYYMWSYPKILVESQTGALLTIGDWTVEVAEQTVYDQIVIDCEAEVIYGADELGDYLGPASQYVTFTPPVKPWLNPDDREYPSLPYGSGIELAAVHDVWDETDPDDPVLIKTYSGTAAVEVNMTRI